MPTPTEDDEWQRIRLTEQVERDRAILAQYTEHLAFYQTRIEEARYELGRLDERLGGSAP